LRQGLKVLLEGAQGTLLDINHGTYPYVTSSSTIAGGALSSLGISPHSIQTVIGIGKAYTTRVGEGPFPTELQEAVGAEIGRRGQEFGATTGRPRRCGWFDGVAMRYASEVNGLDCLFLNKLDVLSGFDEVNIADSYIHPKLGRLTDFPDDYTVLKDCKPNYVTLPGWQENISAIRSYRSLPRNCRKYIETIEELCEIEVRAVGNGPGREDLLVVES
jgi:adenylosuccinate synthase